MARILTVTDPAVRRDKTCAHCGEPLPDTAIKENDPFCSVACCRSHHHVPEPPPAPKLRSAYTPDATPPDAA